MDSGYYLKKKKRERGDFPMKKLVFNHGTVWESGLPRESEEHTRLLWHEEDGRKATMR